MEQTGNPTQWGDGYPKQELIEDDLRQEHSYVCVKEWFPWRVHYHKHTIILQFKKILLTFKTCFVE